MIATATTPDAELFSLRLRTATRAQHQEAEDSRFMAALIDGELPTAGYSALAGQLWHVYVALEDGATQLAEHPVVGPFLARELNRRSALEADLAYLIGPHWQAESPATEATARYADRIRQVALTWPEGFIAHHYTRYLGDLSGGQILLRQLQRAYDFPAEALSFFVFSGIPKPKVFKDRYRDLLDTIALDTAGQDRIIAEARLAFELNTALFTTLGSRFLPDAR